MDLLAKRERQAARLLRVCLKPLNTECIERYVKGFEEGTLVQRSGRLCALGHMGGCTDDGYDRMVQEHAHASVRIEELFEGWRVGAKDHRSSLPSLWSERYRSSPHHEIRWVGVADDPTRKRWIYEAAIAELTRRATAHVKPATTRPTCAARSN